MADKKSAKKISDRQKFEYAITALASVIAIAFVVLFINSCKNGYQATTMRLLHSEGTVTVENSKGGTKPVTENLKFQSGDAVSTGSDGLVSVGLDDTKIVSLDNNSRAEFIQNGKQLELKLTKGAVFFNVTEKLRADEKFEIKTATMTAGIRGTSGVVYYDENAGGKETIALTDGSVEISATNPETGETKTARLEAGNKLTVYLYSGRIEDSVEFEIDEIEEYDISEFALSKIVENDALLKKVCDHTGWNKDKLIKALKDLENNESEPTTSTTSEATTTTTSGTTTSETSDTEATTSRPTKRPTKRPKKRPTKRPTKKPRNKSTTRTSGTSTGGSRSQVSVRQIGGSKF